MFHKKGKITNQRTTNLYKLQGFLQAGAAQLTDEIRVDVLETEEEHGPIILIRKREEREEREREERERERERERRE